MTQELVGLERNGNTGKIDHPDGGTSGSKDQSDAICGALWNASKHAEEFAFEYGEDLSDAVTANLLNSTESKQQIIVDLTEELKNFRLLPQSQQEIGLDFGFGKAQPWGGEAVVADGMLIW